ncbi:hypothetical protein OCH239_04985 [Roseivivax halodurans JCM 10272]|uniref:Uncharacterized protein n=1 Tax=Roseivivax halodurans JCM 10272 TaxID=1449350 RepID=X7EDN9_9RHOB|nr:hypothetical protein [Roseivivax halodurans]ETX14209.1 hypothetical protein OCH239_04985 [Roseivivax halodurans JCM 10272]
MPRIALATLGLASIAAASIAAAGVLERPEQDVIEIEVALDELKECRETLAQVAQMPAVSDNGSPIFFDSAQDLPGVRCVVADV